MTALNKLWYITLADTPSPALTLWGNKVIISVRSPVQAESQTRLEALHLANGHRIWQHTFEHVLISGLAVSGSRLLVSLTSTDLLRGEGALIAFDAVGNGVWRWSPGAQQVSAPALRGDTAFVTVDAMSMVTVDVHTGQQHNHWTLPVSASRAAPAIAGDILLIPCRAPHLLALTLDGLQRWRFDAPGTTWLEQTPTVVGDRIYAALSTGQVVALDLDSGVLRWQRDIGPVSKPLTAPATDGERLYIGARDGLYALDLDGRAVWHVATDRRIATVPVVTSGMVYATCHDHHLYALDAVTGKQVWRYAMERRIEVPPLILSTEETNRALSPQSTKTVEALAIVADASGTVTTLVRPLSAAEHEAAGHWMQAADLWAVQGQPLRQAEALQQHARSQEATGVPLELLAELWNTVTQLYETEEEHGLAANCRREVARCMRKPELTLEIEHEGLVHQMWTTVNFIVRNVGFGLARNVIIHTSGKQFDGEATRTHRIRSLNAGARAAEQLDIQPLECGSSVPLRITMEFMDSANRLYTCAQTLHLPVLLTAPQKRKTTYMQVFTGASAFVDMEVRIFQREVDGYPVEVTLGDGQNFPRGYLDADLANWVSSGDLVVDGQQLFAALTSDVKLHNAWARACGQAPRRRIRLRIDPTSPELHVLPWELLQEDTLWLSANASTPFSRYMPVAEPWGECVEERPLRVLAVIANPANLSEYNLPALNVMQEKAILKEAFAGVPDTVLRLEVLEAPVTLPRVERALQKGYHILHIVGHGMFNARQGKGVLYLEDDNGLTALVDDDALKSMFERQDEDARPRLTLLAACQSATRSTTDAFLGMAPRLIAGGIPAVIAMQMNVSLISAQILSATFYRRLVEHGAVDLALNEARSALLTANRPDATAPVLYMRLKDGQLFRR